MERIFPNIANKLPEFLESFNQTIYMVAISGGISIVFGLILGVLLIVTREDGILESIPVYSILDKLVNVFRTIPFVILLVALIPLTRLIIGSAIGTEGALVPLVFATVPFFARQVESALAEMDQGLVEAAQSMGSSPLEIIVRVYLRESIPNLIRAVTITLISLLGLTAMAGAIGGGGLGDFAIRYGHQRNQVDATYATVAVLIILVTLLQSFSNWIVRKTTH
jgi:D-methionine transport system permease protein